ncbi:DNA glycosylase [Dothidotthia symphoricarpi CBS 119687]|uniref:Endonuclease III homolog n=1 Tax=Dothidotthia symphoricarpi CBS 119687 TaxID=1392245 RepID=A0A6A6A8D0_9PLEO|nr:DNA glycosylase [Dothidotthia symphoricarpi CBS 119687]KAF2126901.1 DNA glycosylase [Dothidotthia symphoricarpi CBS 119687]
MRTSRIARDTSRILAASRAQRPLRHSGPSTSARTNNENAALDSDSSLSSVPDVSSDAETEWGSKKRKRNRGVAGVKSEGEEVALGAIASPEQAKKQARARGKGMDNQGVKSEASPVKKKARRAPVKKSAGGGVKYEAPPNWEEMYTLTRQMRNENVAPVDTMGCESLAERSRTPRDQRFQTLIALMLSSQTKDTVTAVAMKGMQDNMRGGFNLESILAIAPADLNAFISKVGFHNLKTKYIKSTAEILRDKFASDIPDSIPGLVSLPGVGPKMAYLTMSAAWGKDLGIGVDVHVHRITNLWGWHETQTPEQTRAALESWLPRDKWHDINNLLVGFGQTICLPVGRRCGDCKLAGGGLCPSVVVGKAKTKVRVKKEAVVAVEGGGEVVVKEEEVVDEVPVKDEVSIKDEEGAVEDVHAVPDIEDIGKAPRRGGRRK